MPDISDFKGQIDSYKTARDALFFVALFCSSKIPDCWFQRRDSYKQLHRNISQNAPVLRVLCLIERKNMQFRNTIGNLETLCSYCARSCVSVLDAKSSRVARLSKMFLPFDIVMCFSVHCWNLSSDVLSALIAIHEIRGKAVGFTLNSFRELDCRLPAIGT